MVRAEMTVACGRPPIVTGITAPRTAAGVPLLSGSTAGMTLDHRPNGVNGGIATDRNGINGQLAAPRQHRSNGVNGVGSRSNGVNGGTIPDSNGIIGEPA